MWITDIRYVLSQLQDVWNCAWKQLGTICPKNKNILESMKLFLLFSCVKKIYIYLLNTKVLSTALFRALKICYRRWTSLLSTNWVSSALPIYETWLTSHDCTAAPIKRLQQSVLLTFIKYWNPCAVSTKNIRIKVSFPPGPGEFWRHLYHSTYYPANPIWNFLNWLIRYWCCLQIFSRGLWCADLSPKDRRELEKIAEGSGRFVFCRN